MNANKSIGILVAGMHRSGTSALAGTLGKLGISLGGRLLEPGSDNPKGYWEHQGAVEIHERLLTGLERHWDDVRPLPGNWLDSEPAKIAAGEIGKLVSGDFSSSAVWAVKDPRMCRFLPLWIQSLRQLEMRPVVLFMVRRPSEVAASIQARNHWGAPIGIMLWLRHMIEAEEATRALPRTAILYDDLLSDPIAAVTAAMERLSVEIPSPSLAQSSELKRFVDDADRHHVHSATNDVNGSAIDAIARKAYEALTEIAHGQDAWPLFRACAAGFEQEWRSYGAGVDAVADMAHRFRAEESVSREEIYRLKSELNGQVRWAATMVEDHAATLAKVDQVSQELAHAKKEAAELAEKLAARELSLGHEIALLCNQKDELTRELREVSEYAASLVARVDAMRRSRSWKITKPLRAVARLVRPKSRGEDSD